jgi:hypothetical protein
MAIKSLRRKSYLRRNRNLRIKSSLRRNRNLRRTNRVKYGGMFAKATADAVAKAKADAMAKANAVVTQAKAGVTNMKDALEDKLKTIRNISLKSKITSTITALHNLNTGETPESTIALANRLSEGAIIFTVDDIDGAEAYLQLLKEMLN